MTTPKILAPGIEQAEGRCGGNPVIAGTRLTTRLVAINAARYSVEQVIAFWPDLTAERIAAAVEWERDHPTPPYDWNDATEEEKLTVTILLNQLIGDLVDAGDNRADMVRVLVASLEDGTLS